MGTNAGPRSRKLLVLAATLAVALSGGTAVLARADTSRHGWASQLPGCDSSRPAIAHHAGRQVLPDQPANGPVPCGTLTGWPTVENKIEVTNNGTVFYEPALQGGPVLSGDGHVPGWGKAFGFASTQNAGQSWDASSVTVYPDTYVEDGQVDNNVYVDHDTGRLFWYMYNTGNTQLQGVCGNGGGATVAFSGDNGKTWAWAFDADHDCAENPDLLTGKPTVPGEQLAYPNVVYLCGDNTSSGAATLGTPGYSCSKSLTGGTRWLGTTLDDPLTANQGFYSGMAKDKLHPYPQCAGQSSSAGAHVQPLPNGTLVVVVSCNNKIFLSESKDEGATWNVTNEIPHGGVLRIDSAGNMYLAEAGGGGGGNPLTEAAGGGGSSALLLSHSTDGGVTWSPELNVVAPGVDSVGTWTFAQGTYASDMVGNVALTYYGTRHGQTTSDGFITATREALDSNPVFWSGQVNSPTRPLLYNTRTDGNIGVTVLDFNGGAWSPDGQSVWGSWVQDCGENIATSPGCTSRYPHTNPGNPDDGFAGRLVWPPG